ncbi:hypothetical protein L596_015974 [Steinernema carpocapsae]|uniref:C2H2-type domain-containing protein n=2 Tax=Steinernema carpocapsae TaxID=34508 RepID=A0A4U5NGL8_STECR|nr:hypothetical protein L596_015974 [Steinernema carpocapsae]
MHFSTHEKDLKKFCAQHSSATMAAPHELRLPQLYRIPGPGMQQNDFNAFAAMTPSDWSSRSNSWNQPSPKAPPASTPQQLSHLLSPNWAQSAMNQGGFVNSNPLHPQNQQNLLNSIKLEQLAALVSPGQLLNVAGNGQANGGNGGTVAEMSPVFRTPGHFNGTGIKQEYATAGLASHSGNVGNLMGGSGETGGNVSSIANNRANPEDTKPPADQIKINQNRLAALRIEEKVRAEALRLATSIPIKTPQPAQSVTPGPSLPPVSASPAPTVPELLPQAENGDEDELHKLVIADPDTETQKSESEAILPPSTTTNGTPVNRPPGLGPVEAEPGSDVFVCQVCGYTNSSRLNTHVDRKCVMCDYTSRTEGRLKKHMADQHTADQKAAVGYVDEMNPNGNFHENGLEELSEDVVTALDQMRALAERPTSAEPMETDALPGTSSVGDKSSPDGTPGKPKPVRKQRNKSYTCKHCKHVSLTKEERHMHSATHIPESRRLYCKLEGCSFVTGYKHHLDYHIKNHNRQKPFSCPKCKYTCVNKSMLNSHLKSHSEKYEHQCRNCNYRAKHSHSLQSHLLKYSHERYELPRTKGAQKEQNWNGDDAQVHVEASGAIGDLQSSGMLLPTTSSLNLSLLLRQAEQGSFDLSQLPGSSSFQSTLRPGPCPVCEFQCLTLQEQLHHNVTCLLASQTSLNSSANSSPKTLRTCFQPPAFSVLLLFFSLNSPSKAFQKLLRKRKPTIWTSQRPENERDRTVRSPLDPAKAPFPRKGRRSGSQRRKSAWTVSPRSCRNDVL